MKRLALTAALACLAGCSNAPIAGFMDNCFPSRAKGDAAVNPPPRPLGDPVAPAPGPRPDALPPPDLGTP